MATCRWIFLGALILPASLEVYDDVFPVGDSQFYFEVGGTFLERNASLDSFERKEQILNEYDDDNRLMKTAETNNVSLEKFLPGKRNRKNKVTTISDSIQSIFMNIITDEFSECLLVVVWDVPLRESPVIDLLASLPNQKQVVEERGSGELRNLQWKANQCRGYFFLLSDALQLLYHAEHAPHYLWDYSGRFVVLGLTEAEFEALITTNKGRKTEHIIGIITTKEKNYKVLKNLLYQRSVLSHVFSVSSHRNRNVYASHTDAMTERFTMTTNLNAALSHRLFSDKLNNLKGTALRVITFAFPPDVMYRRGSDGQLLERFGHNIRLVETIAEVFNFTITFLEPPKGELWGEPLEDGTWNGMVGMLGRGVGDIGVANFYITALEGRREFTDYSTPFGQEESCFLLRKEAPSPRWQSLALPFTGDTWIGILVVVSLMGPIFYCLASFSTTRKESLAEHSLVFTSLYTIGVTLRVSRPFLPNHPSLQVFLVFLWLYVIIVTVAYCANLTAFLTVERVPEGITSLQELYNSPLLVYGQGPFFGDNMAEAKNQYVKGLADRFFAMSNIEEIYKKLISGYGVYISSRNHLVYTGSSYASSVGVPTLRIIPECFQPFNVAIGLQSHSPLKRYFDTAVLWLTEGGFLHHWFDETLLQARIYRMSEKEREEEDKNIKGNAKEKEFSGIPKNIALTVEHIQGTFMILGIGCGISYLAFVIECSTVTLLRK